MGEEAAGAASPGNGGFMVTTVGTRDLWYKEAASAPVEREQDSAPAEQSACKELLT